MTDDPASGGFRSRWLPSGEAGLTAMQRLINQAGYNVQLQTYIFNDDQSGREMLAALEAAAARGVRVRVLVDALGSMLLPRTFFDAFMTAGGELRWFNPLRARRLVYRNHRKLLVVDRQQAVIGGFNVGDEYAGDGVQSGWFDLGMVVRGVLVDELAQSFDRLYGLAGEGPRRLARLRAASERRVERTAAGQLLLSGPGRGHNPLKASLLRDLARARSVVVVTPYFLPTWSLRRRLMNVVRRGGRVQLLLPGVSDVDLALRAGQHLYKRLLRAGVEIFEYQPQILHAKLFIIDQQVYVGSANFNTRSLHIDYELMLRLDDPLLVEQARELFSTALTHARPIEPAQWKQRNGYIDRLRQRLSYWLMARVDPLVARWLWDRSDR